MKKAALLMIALAIGAVGQKIKRGSQPPPEIMRFNLPDQLVHTGNGDVLFRDLILGQCASDPIPLRTVLYLQGNAVNLGKATWTSLIASLDGVHSDGTTFAFGDVDLWRLSPGATEPLGTRASGEIERCGSFLGVMTMESANRSRDLIGLGINFRQGSFDARYDLALIKPIPSDSLSFADDKIQVLFQVSKNGMSFSIKNNTEAAVRILWDQVAFVDWGARSHQVIHKGVKYADKGGAKPITVIPPGAAWEDTAIPEDNITFVSGDWAIDDFLPPGPKAMDLKGKTVSIFMPLEINGKATDYNFVFQVRDVKY